MHALHMSQGGSAEWTLCAESHSGTGDPLPDGVGLSPRASSGRSSLLPVDIVITAFVKLLFFNLQHACHFQLPATDGARPLRFQICVSVSRPSEHVKLAARLRAVTPTDAVSKHLSAALAQR